MIETTKIDPRCIIEGIRVRARPGDTIKLFSGDVLRGEYSVVTDEEFHTVGAGVTLSNGESVRAVVIRPRDREAELDFAVAEIADKLHCLSCPHSRECGVQGTRYGENCINAIKQHIIESAQKTKP